MNKPSVSSIWVSPSAGAAMLSLERAEVEEGRGIVGDRYHAGVGTFSRWAKPGRAISLIAQESLDAINEEFGIDLNAGRSRRNVVTSGIDLDTLLGRKFRVGTVTMKGSGTCSPCRYLERHSPAGTFDAMRGKGGIRAMVLESGSFAQGDLIHSFGPVARLPKDPGI